MLTAVLALCLTAHCPAVQAVPADTPVPARVLALLNRFRHHKRARRAAVDSTHSLQAQFGYDGSFDAADTERDESATLSVILSPGAKWEIEGDFDVWATQGPPDLDGHGDAHLSVQRTLLTSKRGGLTAAAAYELKVPTASPGGLGSGRYDHRLLLPLSASLGRWEADLTTGADANGRAGGGMDWGAEAALSLSRPFTGALSAQFEWSGQTVETDLPAGQYASADIILQLGQDISIDLAGRIGLTRDAPRRGAAISMTAALPR